ncbi:MAG: D-glycerate dehydrogenase [bacterium]|nr:D-glycerate dehydrogenase [bacterium]
MPKVFITTKIPDAGLNLLKEQGYELEIGSATENLPHEEIARRAKGADALLTQLEDRVDGNLLDGLGPQLKIVANYAVGYDNFDLKELAQRNIIATNTPGVLTEAVAEYAVGLILALFRKIPEADRFTRSGKYKGFDPDLLVGSELQGKILGLVGHGRIGCRVAEILQKGFGMNVVYYDTKRDEAAEATCGIAYGPLEEVLSSSDVVTLHVPLLPATRHLISEKELSSMKPSSFLVNTSRGAVIDEKALVRVLQEKKIAGAALDVYEEEPNLAPGLSELENVLLSPHIASATKEAREHMAIVAASNIIAVLSGKPPLNQVK